MLLHHCSWDPHHIESPERLRRIWTRCEDLNLVKRCTLLPSREAEDAELLLYHSQQFIDIFEQSRTQTSEQSETVCENYDSVYLCPDTAVAARLSAAAAVDLVESVLAEL